MPSGWLDALDSELQESRASQRSAGSCVEDAAGLAGKATSSASARSRSAPVRGRGRGRPVGSNMMREFRKRKVEQHTEAEAEASDDEAPEANLSPIEKARKVLQEKRAAKASSSTADKRAAVQSGEIQAFGALQHMQSVGSLVQLNLLAAAAESSQQTQEDEAGVLRAHLRGRLLTTPWKALSSLFSEAPSTVASKARSVGAAVVELGSWLWSSMYSAMQPLYDPALQPPGTRPRLRPLMYVMRFRYDETPSKVRVLTTDKHGTVVVPRRDATSALAEVSSVTEVLTAETGAGLVAKGSAGMRELVETSVQSKIIQCEYCTGMLLQDLQSKQYYWVFGELPTWLMAVDRCTGENTRRCLMDVVQASPEMSRIWSSFEIKLRVSTTDRFGANARAEAGLTESDFMPAFRFSHMPCDVHRLSTATGSAVLLQAADVSGVLSTGLACGSLGSTRKLREILSRIFMEELDVEYSSPPVSQQREHMLELLLPADAPTRALRKQNSIRKFILRRFLILGLLEQVQQVLPERWVVMNGDLSDGTIRHHCVYGCCRNQAETAAYFKTYVVWALLPAKIPVYSRKSWVGYDSAIDAIALLECHHGLFSRCMEKFVGSPTNLPKADDDEARGPVPQGWAAALEAEVHVAPVSSAGSAAEPQADVQHAAAEDGEGPDRQQWAEFNRKKKQDVRSWYGTRPGNRLLLLKEMLSVMLGLMRHFLTLGSRRWEEAQLLQVARNEDRDYIMLSAARGAEVQAAMQALKDLLHKPMRAIPTGEVTAALASLRFRLGSAAMSAMHVLIRTPRQNLPYCMFGVLQKDAAGRQEALRKLTAFPPCMHDSLFSLLRQHFPSDADLESSDFEAVLTALAAAYCVDISTIESRHASSREFTLLRSRGWVPNLEAVGSKFATQRYANAPPASAPPEKTAEKPKQPRGGGGPWRAFVSDQSAGRQFSSTTALSEEYRALADHEKQRYKDAGAAGTAAHQAGFPSFGDSRRRQQRQRLRSLPPPARAGEILPGGAIVLPDVERPNQVVPYNGPSFEEELEQHIAQITAPGLLGNDGLNEAEVLEIESFQQDLPAGTPLLAVFEGQNALQQSFSRDTFSRTQSRGLSERGVSITGLTWTPPTARLVEALVV
ncbi:unnamed protein product [Symbiodinium sp. CCMP2592]|nr:unnamed protein product [Symbiodinium sp. CCMP2592]